MEYSKQDIINEDGCSVKPASLHAAVIRSRGNFWTIKQIQIKFKVGSEEAKAITIKLIKAGVLEMIPAAVVFNVTLLVTKIIEMGE